MRHMLLPFSHGIDAAAIEQAIALAQDHTATLVPLSIIRLAGRHRCARLECIQQSKDFLTLVEQKAARAGIPVQAMERYACEEAPTIEHIAMELQSTGILLFVRQQKGLLLSSGAIQQLLHDSKRPCYLSLLPPRYSPIAQLRWSLSNLVHAGSEANKQHAQEFFACREMRSVLEW